MKKTLKLTRLSLMLALCILLNFIESFFPISSAFPGVKAGLSNIPVMFMLIFVSFPNALTLVLLKGLFVLLSRGVSAGLLSLAGGFLSITVMWGLKKLFKDKLSFTTLSVSGAVCHNAAQLFITSLMWKTLAVWSISPILIVSGVVFGVINALLLKTAVPYLEKIKS